MGGHVSVKEAVLPFNRFPDVDTLLGPEMRATGEVMGIDATFGLAFAKSQIAAGDRLPEKGTVFMSLADRDKPGGILAARRFVELGFSIVATAGTAEALRAARACRSRAWCRRWGRARRTRVDLIAAGKIDLVVNTPRGRGPRADGAYIRLAANVHNIPCLTTAAAALAAVAGVADWSAHGLRVRSLQEFHRGDQLRLPL